MDLNTALWNYHIRHNLEAMSNRERWNVLYYRHIDNGVTVIRGRIVSLNDDSVKFTL